MVWVLILECVLLSVYVLYMTKNDWSVRCHNCGFPMNLITSTNLKGSGKISENLMQGHTYSNLKDGILLEWKISSLIEASAHIESCIWEIPRESFLGEWYWGDEHPSEHVKRVLEADLSYPVLVFEGHVIDGCHRVLKALLRGDAHITAKIIRDMPPPDLSIEIAERSEGSDKWSNRDLFLILKETNDFDSPTSPCDL